LHRSSYWRLDNESSKSRITVVAESLAILVPAMIIYWQDLDLVFRDALVNDFMNYTLITPLLILFILYRKRKMLNAVSFQGSDQHRARALILTGQMIAGISLFSVSFLTYFLGSYTSYALEFHLLSFPFFVAGVIVLVFNLETLRALLFPVALLFFIQPYFIQLVNPFWSDLSWISSTSSYNLLKAIGVPASFTTLLEVPTIEITAANGDTLTFTVGVASSGLNSFVGFTVFAIFVAYILRAAVWKRISLMVIGYPMLLLLNTLRITIILSLAYQWGTTIAEIFHLTGGLVLIFLGTMLLLLVGERILKVKVYPSRAAPSRCTYCDKGLRNKRNFCLSCGRLLKQPSHVINKRSALRIILVIFVLFLFLSVQTPPIAVAKSPTEINLAAISEEESKQLLPIISGWDLEFMYRDNDVERILKQDAALLFAYTSRDNANRSFFAYIVVTVQISPTRHSWEASLITWPARFGRPTATVLDLRDIPILSNPTLTGRFFAFIRPNSNPTEVVLYWYERVPFKIGEVWEMRNVQISLWSYSADLAKSGLISSPDDLAGVEKVYLPFARSIANYWQPIKTSSLVTAVVSGYGDKIVATTCGLLIGTTLLFALKRRKERKTNANTYQKLSASNKRIIDIVHQTEKATTPTTEAIANKYQCTTGQNIAKEELLQKLIGAEKTGIIKSCITNEFDEPIQTWKTQIDFRSVRNTLRSNHNTFIRNLIRDIRERIEILNKV